MAMATSKLTAEGIIGEAVRIGAKMSGGEFPIEAFPIRIQRIISSLHDCQGYLVDYVAAAILAAIAVGIWQLPSGAGEAQLAGKSHSVHGTDWSPRGQ